MELITIAKEKKRKMMEKIMFDIKNGETINNVKVTKCPGSGAEDVNAAESS